jgi:hypothetical protein
MPRLEEILDVTHPDGFSRLLSHFMHNHQQSSDEAESIFWRSIFLIADGIRGRGELN